MAIESKPLFHPEVMRQQVRSFKLPERVEGLKPRLQHWADLIASGRADDFKQTDLLPDFLTDIFCNLLGYTRPAGPADTFTLSRETHVEVDGQFADAVLGRFQKDKEQFIVALEGKGTRDPLDRPFAGRRMSAVDQAYRYAINLPCDWIIVTSMRETRLYHKGSNQHAYERFETVRLASDPAPLKRFVFLLGAERVVPEKRDCHLYELLKASESVGRELTNQFYALYADVRQKVLTRLCRENTAVAPQEILRCTHEAKATGTARKALIDPNAYDLNALNEPQRKALIRFWEAWQEELKNLRILDPACGSGAFLIEAFDQLHALYEISNARLEELRGHRTLFDLDRQILQHNLYGVDLNAEAIQICQLSLWIKTAARGKVLTSLDHTIREGNSVISDPAVHPKGLDWQAAFPEVFAQGGFDVVVGNPPYVRQELLTPFKPWLETHYETFHGMADLLFISTNSACGC